MKKIKIDTITNDETYGVPKTDKNIEALVNADYTKPTMIMLEDANDDIVGIISTEVQGFYTEGTDEYDEDEDKEEDESAEDDSSTTEESNSVFSYSNNYDMEKEKGGFLSYFRH